MNRKEIKARAKDVVKGRLWDFWKGYLVLSLILYIIEVACVFIVGFLKLGETGSSIASLISFLIIAPISMGFIYYSMRYARKESLELNDLFRYKRQWIPTFLIIFLISLFTTLWTFLFIIPGIVAALSYSMAQYIYCDTEKDARECIRDSKVMMKGYKWDYFIFSLSFIGWIILGALTFGILYIWLTPYMTTAEVLYYDELKKIKSN